MKGCEELLEEWIINNYPWPLETETKRDPVCMEKFQQE